MFEVSIDPVILRIGPLTIGAYGLMVALAVLTVVFWTVREARKDDTINADTVFTAALIAIPSGIVFSKVLHVIDQWRYYLDNPGRIINGEGLTIWGAVLGAAIGVWAYSWFSRSFRFSRFGDLVAPGIILAQAVGRIGCTLNGCCYGLENDGVFSIVYTNPNSFGPLGRGVLQTQLFEIGYDLVIFAVLYFLRGRLKPEGGLFTLYFFLYGAWRFAIEFIRAGTPFVLGMHQAQFIGLIVVALTLPIILLRVRLAKNELEAVTLKAADRKEEIPPQDNPL